MRRQGMIWLSIGVFLILCSQAFALEVKFSGEFVAGGMAFDKTTVRKDTASDGPSTAFYFQRLRVKTDFVVAQGLTLITRFDAMERAWGALRSAPATGLDTMSAGTRAENENLSFDWVYLTYKSPVGLWRAGYMSDGAWGTAFMDTSTPRGKLAWVYTTPQWMFTLQIAKMAERSYSVTSPGQTASDLDGDKYCGAFRYRWNGGETGILIGLGRDAGNKPSPQSYKSVYNNFMPYVKAQIGPVRLQAEVIYFIGKLRDYEEDAYAGDVKIEAFSGWVDATADLGRFYAGGTLAYVAGDDPGTADKAEGDAMRNNGGRDWSPCLIMWNEERSYWAGNIDGHQNARQSSPMYNAWFFQVRGGVKPVEKIDIMASVSWAGADKKPTADWLHNDYGAEIDVIATYKITNNLSYMVGFGYLLTGKYYRGTSDLNAVCDDYLAINKLTLTF